MNIDQTIKEIEVNLETIAKDVVSKRIAEEKNSLFKKLQEQFLMELDSPLQHQPRWHQWGIVTHTRKFMQFYDLKVQEDLQKWGIYDEVRDHLLVEIDGIAKSKLIHIGILLHDIGKFQKNYLQLPNGEIRYGFREHERYSYEIIHGELFSFLHKTHHLTPAQIEYIAMCARYHFELGIVRDVAKRSPHGYTVEFAHSNRFREIVLDAISGFGEYGVEVGLLFLADSYAKSDIEYRDRTDQEIIQELRSKGLSILLIDTIKQVEINVEVAKEYFSILFGLDLSQQSLSSSESCLSI